MPNPSRRIKIPVDVYERLQAIAHRWEQVLQRTVRVAEVATEALRDNLESYEEVNHEQNDTI